MVGHFWWFSKWGASVHASVRDKIKQIYNIYHVKIRSHYQTHFRIFCKYYAFITNMFIDGLEKTITQFWTTQNIHNL